MISLEKYKKVLDSGLLMDHYLVLCNIRDGVEMPKSRRIDGFINLLNKKGYIEDGMLTDKSFELINSQPIMIVSTREIETPKFDFGSWIQELHEECQRKLIDLTGRKQVTSKIKKTDKKGYPFLPNPTDLGKKLLTVISLYKLKDMDLMKKTLINHINNCNNSGDWFPLIKYYIMKDGSSDLVTDMNSAPEISDSSKSIQKFV